MLMVVAGQDQSRCCLRGMARGAALLVAALAIMPCGWGCSLPKMPRAINDTDPTAKIPAIKTSAATRDRKSVAQLVDELESDDAAIRFYAIRALKDITGETFGYRYFDDELERREEMLAWRRWLAQETGVPMPSTNSTTVPTPAPAAISNAR